MTQLVVRIPEEQKQMLTLIAQQERQPLSQIVRRALDTFVASKKRGKKNDLLQLVAIAEKYKGPIGPRDLSTNYKRYLYGDKRL
ncbi:MAG: hypothetical protein Q7S76_04390 [bacterium]|nr:hypothetical protein [bacterium]